ncbi:hypothetical protein [Thermoproteus uzoniensis]|nr:hypothetical protein [Thermoproteus uzoniensis]
MAVFALGYAKAPAASTASSRSPRGRVAVLHRQLELDGALAADV